MGNKVGGGPGKAKQDPKLEAKFDDHFKELKGEINSVKAPVHLDRLPRTTTSSRGELKKRVMPRPSLRRLLAISISTN